MNMTKTFEQITEQYVAEAMRGALDGFIGASTAKALRTYADDPTIWGEFWEVINGNWKQDNRGNWVSEDRQWVWLLDPDGHLPYSEQFIPIEKYVDFKEEIKREQKQAEQAVYRSNSPRVRTAI